MQAQSFIIMIINYCSYTTGIQTFFSSKH